MNKKLIKKRLTTAGGPLQLTPEELRYLEWSKMTPKLQLTYRINRAKAYFDDGQLWNAAKSYFGGFDPKNPHLITGEAPSPGMRGSTQILLGVLKAKSIALRAAKISNKIFDKQYFKALNSGNPQRVKAVRDLHFKGKSMNNQINKQLYHGTPEVFNEFKITDTADPIFHTTETKEVASKIAGSKGRVLNLFGYSKNPLRISDLGVVWHPSNIARELKVQLPRDKVRYPLELYERELMYKLNNSKTYREEANRSFMEKELKGDSYVYKNEVEGGGDSYAFPTSRQLKLSNSITYDDSGNIIPISLRDNFLINDIRYKQGGKMNILEFLKNGSGIHIKEKNKGKFTSYCGGKVTDECILKGKNSSNPAIRKRATFADNARHFKHKKGGKAFVSGVSILDSNPNAYKEVKKRLKKHLKGGKTSTWLKIGTGIGNFLNSDIGKGVIGLGTQLFGTISGTKKAADFSSDYDEATKANVKAMTELLRAKNKKEAGILAAQFISYLLLQNPDNHYGELDLLQITLKIADSLYDPQEIVDYLNLRNAEKLKYMLAIQGSAGNSINWLDSLGGIASSVLNSNSNTGKTSSTAVLPKLTTNKYTPSTSLSNPVLGNNALGYMPDYSFLLNPSKPK